MMLFVQDSLLGRKLKEQPLFEIEIFCNIRNIFIYAYIFLKYMFVQYDRIVIM